MAQLGNPDMRLPIQYALSYPDRWGNCQPGLDLAGIGALTFAKPATGMFPCLELAFVAAHQGGTMPAVMNAANEEAVKLFLEKKIGFLDIPLLIEKTMGKHSNILNPGLDEILEYDRWARQEACGLVQSTFLGR
jgi:1-deoxy-D-xylulose-5-phosphate reductoisomerase